MLSRFSLPLNAIEPASPEIMRIWTVTNIIVFGKQATRDVMWGRSGSFAKRSKNHACDGLINFDTHNANSEKELTKCAGNEGSVDCNIQQSGSKKMGVTADLQPSSNLQSEDYKELRNALRGNY